MTLDGVPAVEHSQSGWPWEAPPSDPATVARHATGPADQLPRITVITPSFNQGDFLEATIRSVLLQDYPNLQYIVVDGGSSDRSGEILDRYADKITHLIREPDDGQSDAICKGLDLADGVFSNWINSDDVLEPGTLWEVGTSFRDTNDLYTFSVRVEGDGIESYLMHNENLSARGMLRGDRCSFSQPGLWFRLDRLRQCGGIDRSLNYGFDWDLLVRYLNENPRVYYSSSVGAMFRLHDLSKTVVETNKGDDAQNSFRREAESIRDKLERTLPKTLADASRLGRRREPWNQYMIGVLDDFDRSPLAAALEISSKAMLEPRARCSTRTLGSIARLLSRYVRGRPTERLK